MRKIIIFILILPFLSSTDFFKIKEIDVNLSYPWGMTWINDESLLITQKNGKIFLVNYNKMTQTEIKHNIPSVQVGQGGLLDIVYDGEYIWLTASIEKNGKYTTALYRAVLNGNNLSDSKLIYEAKPYLTSTKHFGSRIEVTNNYVFMTIGEREGGMIAQDYTNSVGSVIRLNRDGSIPDDNPYTNNPDWLPELYQIGVRNPQGITKNPLTGEVYISNHGPKGGDFIGPVIKGSNYGWKQIGWGGTNYSGTIIGEGNTWEPGFLKPDYTWIPSIGIGGIKYYKGNMFPQWNNQLLIASLRDKYLSVLSRLDNNILQEEIILINKIGRVRDIEINKKGEIFLIADEKKTKLYKLTGD